MKQADDPNACSAGTAGDGLPALPDDRMLARGLAGVMTGSDPGKMLRIVDRSANDHSSTFVSEIVTCVPPDADRCVQVLCKFDLPIRTLACEHRHGVGYEAEVYRAVLGRSACSTPRCYGYCDTEGAASWLAIEYLPEAVKVTRTSKPREAIEAAAVWLGRFHAEHEVTVEGDAIGQLRLLDADFLRRWSEAIAEGYPDLLVAEPWLARVCERDAANAAVLAEAPLSVVHGEFYPNNVLVDAGRVMPIDWESAGIGPGELDFAALTEGWPADVVVAWQRAYCRTRWGSDTPPTGFTQRVEMVRLHLAIRWLHASLALTPHKQQRAMDAIRRVARETGAI